MTRVAVLTPLPPTRSGIAHYSEILVPALARHVDVKAFATLDGYRREDFDAAVYQLGNNPHHEVMYREAMANPGVAVLHDLVLHHLIVELTLARGDAEGYVAALEASHGAAGAAWARGRAAGLHSEMGNFLLPASVELARRSRSVIVHNRYAADRLRSFGVTTPIHIVPHPAEGAPSGVDGAALRARLGIASDARVIGFFGFLTSAKRADVVLEAFRAARAKDPRLVLLVVGEPAPNIDVAALQSDGVVFTGYVSDDDFGAYYAVADRLVNLRYPSAGETSGTLMRALAAGKPVAVSDYAQFAEYPDDCVSRIPLGSGEVEALVLFFLRELPDPSAAQRRWLDENASIELTVRGYLDAIADATAAPHPAPHQRSGTRERGLPAGLERGHPLPADARRGAIEGSASAALPIPLPLFPRLSVVSFDANTMEITLRNDGDSVLRTHTYGTPEYRLIAQVVEGDRIVEDRWLALPCDLHPGDEAKIKLPIKGGRGTLRLYHAIQDVDLVAPRAWTSLELSDVR